MPFVPGHLKFTGKRDQWASGNQPARQLLHFSRWKPAESMTSLERMPEVSTVGKFVFAPAFPCHFYNNEDEVKGSRGGTVQRLAVWAQELDALGPNPSSSLLGSWQVISPQCSCFFIHKMRIVVVPTT